MKNKIKTTNSFGNHLRAYRIGYRVSTKFKCFAQIKKVGENFAITLCPLDEKPPQTKGKEHICWWESEEGEKIWDLIPMMKNIVRIKKILQFTVNSDGKRI
jgi:ATP:corrinoid adenosyltransferase